MNNTNSKNMTKEEYIKYQHFIQHVNKNRLLDEVDYIYIFALAHTEGDITEENLEKHYKDVVLERQREANSERATVYDVKEEKTKRQAIRFSYNMDDVKVDVLDLHSDAYINKIIRIEEESKWDLLMELD